MNFETYSPCHRTTIAHFLNHGKWDDGKAENINTSDRLRNYIPLKNGVASAPTACRLLWGIELHEEFPRLPVCLSADSLYACKTFFEECRRYGYHTPEGYARWTLRLLAEYCMENQYIVSISHTAIGDMLNTNGLKPHLSKYWCIPKLNDAAFVANMEDVLTIYEMPYNPEIPVICMDEKPVQLLGEIRERIQAQPIHTHPDTQLPQPGYCEKIDSEYVRCGTASIFMFTEPLGGWRHVLAKEYRKRGDFAQMMLNVAETYYPDVKKIILVADNLNTHSRTSFYEAFKPSTACWLSQKYDIHYTPKHGSWLNMEETELSSMTLQCLGNQRIEAVEHLNELLGAWEISRNQRQKGIIWHFKTEDARIKLYRLYPKPIFSD